MERNIGDGPGTREAAPGPAAGDGEALVRLVAIADWDIRLVDLIHNREGVDAWVPEVVEGAYMALGHEKSLYGLAPGESEGSAKSLSASVQEAGSLQKSQRMHCRVAGMTSSGHRDWAYNSGLAGFRTPPSLQTIKLNRNCYEMYTLLRHNRPGIGDGPSSRKKRTGGVRERKGIGSGG